MVRKKYRSHVGVILQILDILASQERVNITTIIREANLAYDRAKTYLDRLEKEAYVEQETQGRRKLYTITDKGKQFLKNLRATETFFESLGFPL